MEKSLIFPWLFQIRCMKSRKDRLITFFSVHENCNVLGKMFRAEDIKIIVECLNNEFEKYAILRLKWTSKHKIESSCISPDFPFSLIFV